MAIDLEMNQPSGTIIQIGVSVGDTATRSIIETRTFDIKVEEQLSDFIIKLTGITQNDVDNGILLVSAYEQTAALHNKHSCFCNLVTWGGGDTETLRKQLGLEVEGSGWWFGRRWIDVKTLFVSMCISHEKSIQSGLAKSMSRTGLRFEGRKHNAGSDAENTLLMYFDFLRKFKKIPFIEAKND